MGAYVEYEGRIWKVVHVTNLAFWDWSKEDEYEITLRQPGVEPKPLKIEWMEDILMPRLTSA